MGWVSANEKFDLTCNAALQPHTHKKRKIRTSLAGQKLWGNLFSGCISSEEAVYLSCIVTVRVQCGWMPTFFFFSCKHRSCACCTSGTFSSSVRLYPNGDLYCRLQRRPIPGVRLKHRCAFRCILRRTSTAASAKQRSKILRCQSGPVEPPAPQKQRRHPNALVNGKIPEPGARVESPFAYLAIRCF